MLYINAINNIYTKNSKTAAMVYAKMQMSQNKIHNQHASRDQTEWLAGVVCYNPRVDRILRQVIDASISLTARHKNSFKQSNMDLFRATYHKCSQVFFCVRCLWRWKMQYVTRLWCLSFCPSIYNKLCPLTSQVIISSAKWTQSFPTSGI